MDARGKDAFARGSLTWAAYGLGGYFAFMEAVLGPLMPFLRGELGLGYAAASLHFSAFAAGAVLTGLLGDRVVGRWGRRASLWRGAAGMAVGAAVLLSGPVAQVTVPGTFVMGVSGALLLVTIEATLSDGHGEWRAVALSELNIVASSCAVAAPLLVGAFTSFGLGWRAAFVPPALLLCALFAVFRSKPLGETSGAEDPGAEAAKPGHGEPLPTRYWAFWGLVALGVASEWCIAYWGTDFLVDGTGLSRPAAATSLSLFFVAMLAGRVLGARLARTMSPTALLFLTLCVALAGFPVLWTSAGTGLSLVGLFATGLGIGSVYPLGISAALSTAPANTDAAAARLAVGGGGAVLIAPFVLGSLADAIGIQAAFGIVAPMLLAAVALAFVARS